MIFYICIIVSIIAISVALNYYEYPVLRGIVKASGVSEHLSLRILCIAAIIVTVTIGVLNDNSISDAAAEAAGTIPDYGFIAVGLSVIVSLAISRHLSPFMAVPYTFIAALIGYRTGMEGSFDILVAARYIGLWIGYSLACMLLAAVFYKFIAFVSGKTTHLLRQANGCHIVSYFASILMMAAFGWNNSVLMTLFPEYAFGNTWLTAIIAIATIAGIVPILSKRISARSWAVSDVVMDLNSQSNIAIALSIAVTFAIAPVPLSSECLLVSAICGISYLRGRALIEGRTVFKVFLSTIISTASGFLVSYCLCKMLDGTHFSSVMAVITVATGSAMVLYMAHLRREDIENRVNAARQRQLHNTEQSLAALEVRTEMNEKELMNRLELKRKELVDFAVGVSDQKEFMEKVYEGLKEAREIPDESARDKQLDRLLTSLRQRMYFTREMNDFYARSEVLHSDFNTRLSEAFPDLTEGERKLAILLRQGFSSKYIATLMNITPKSVEISRYRLRIKLGLDRSDNLVKFIKSI